MSRRVSRNLCPRLQSATDLLCKRWTGLIVHVLLRGPRRFNELLAELEVVSDRMLSERLKELEAQSVVTRRVVGQQPIRVEYTLTDKGTALGPVLAAMQQWSEAWNDDGTLEPPVRPQAAAPAAG